MGLLRSVARAVVPKRMRGFVRSRYYGIFLRRGMRTLLSMKNPFDPPPSVLRDLVKGWGNPSMSVLDEFIRAFLGCMRETDGPILECGSGLSTVLIGVAAARSGRRLFSLEHSPAWAERVSGVLRRYGIESVDIFVSGLRRYGEFSWYDPPLGSLPSDFSLVVCDGPPWDTPGGRYGLLPVMRSHLRAGCIILLDDAHRPAEKEIAVRWAQELGTAFTIEGTGKPYAKLRVPS